MAGQVEPTAVAVAVGGEGMGGVQAQVQEDAAVVVCIAAADAQAIVVAAAAVLAVLGRLVLTPVVTEVARLEVHQQGHRHGRVELRSTDSAVVAVQGHYLILPIVAL